MCNLIKNAMNAVRKFTVVDFAIFKIYLVLVGILFGAYFSTFFLKHIFIVWVVAVIALIIVLVQLIRYGCSCKKKD